MCEDARNVHHSGEEAHRAGKAVSTEPSEHLLGAVGKKYHSQCQSKNGYGSVVIRRYEFSNHKALSCKPKLLKSSQTADKMKYPHIRILFVELNTPVAE